MPRDPIGDVTAALAQTIMRERPWWDVRGGGAPEGPPGAGLIEVRVRLRESGHYRRLRIWFRLDTPADEAVALLDQLLPDPAIANETDLYAWECRVEEAPGARPARQQLPRRRQPDAP